MSLYKLQTQAFMKQPFIYYFLKLANQFVNVSIYHGFRKKTSSTHSLTHSLQPTLPLTNTDTDPCKYTSARQHTHKRTGVMEVHHLDVLCDD